MNAEAIVSTARQAWDFDSIEIHADHVWFMDRFSCEEHDEPHDVAYACLGIIQDELEMYGLCAVDVESDNDSLWGRITIKASAAQE